MAIYQSNTLDQEVNQNVTAGTDNKAVRSALNVIYKNNDVKIKRDNMNLLIQELFEEGFDVSEPSGPKKITSAMLQQAIWRTMNRTKPLDFSIHGTGRDQNMNMIVTDAVQTVMDKGGYVTSLRGKAGIFQKMYLYGDAFLMIGTDPDGDNEYPIQFTTVSNSNIYFDSYATGIRAGADGSRCTELVSIFSMSWGEFCEKYPNMEKKAGAGRIPRDTGLLKETERNYLQTFKLTDMVEVAHYYNLNTRTYTCFAGSACTVIEEFKNKEYPFVLNGEPYIPVCQFICQPSSNSIYNHGIGEMLYRLAVVSRRLFNMSLGHVEDNTYPITLVNVPQGEAGKFFNKLQLAHEMRDKGKKGMVAMEYDPMQPGSSRVTSEALLTNSLMNEWQILFDRLDKEINRLGINLDDMDRTNVTATQIIAEEENANAFVKQTQEYNASEYKFVAEVTLDFIQKFCKKSKTKLNLSTEIEMEGQKVKMDEVTLGMVADELNKYDYYVRVNARTGALPTNVMEQAQVSRVLSSLPPGSPGFNKMLIQFARLNGQQINPEDIAPPMQGGPSSQGPSGDVPNQAPMSETDRMVIGPGASRNPIPAF